MRNLSRAGYTPVVAHAERYRCLRKGKRVEELIDLEALIQMNYRSVSGGWHDATARWCKDNLKKRNIHFMGTDMHNIGSRMPDTKEAMGWMRKHLDSTYLRQITRENALRNYRKQNNKIAVITGALLYAFSMYILVMGFHHPFFINPLIYFPLLLIGIERILEEKSPIFFILMVFICTISNFYLCICIRFLLFKSL